MRSARMRAFGLKDAVSLRTMEAFSISPDGQVAFVVSEPAPDFSKMLSRVWVLDAGAPEGARAVTSAEHRASQPHFSPDGRGLAYLTECKDGVMQVAVLTELGEPRVVTGFERGVDAFSWSPDGRRFLVLAAPDLAPARKKAIEAKNDASDVDTDAPSSRMWLVGTEGGKPKAIGPRDGHIVRATWSPDGKKVAFLHSAQPHLDSILSAAYLRTMSAAGRNVRTLMRLHGLDSCGVHGATPRFSPDGSCLAVNCTREERHMGPDTIWVVRCSDGRATELDRDADERGVLPRWLDGRTVVFFQTQNVRRVLRRAYTDGRASDNLVDLPGFVNDCEVSPDGRKVYFSYTDSIDPFDVYCVAADGGAPERLTRLNGRFDSVRRTRAEVVHWKSREGWDMEGLLYRPTFGRAPYATVVIPHGGPHGQSNNAHDPVALLCAANGYAVFLPNFRGGTGRGTAFYRSIVGDWGDGPADDIMRGVRALVRRGLADGERLVVNGGSYGGYITAWLIGRTRAFRAAVAHAPVIDGQSMWGTTDMPSFIAWDFRGSKEDLHAAFWRQSPAAYLHRAKTPTLITVGEKDVRVPPGQAQELYQGLKSAGVETALVVYPREGHGITEPRHRIDQLRRTLEWFARHLGKGAAFGRKRVSR